MSNDLTNALSDALHSQEISENDLQMNHLRLSRKRSMRPLAVACTGIMATVAVAVGVIIVRSAGDSPTPSQTLLLSNVVGYQWQVINLTDANGTVSVPSSLGAYVAFGTEFVLGNDSTDAVSCHYTRTAEGYQVQDCTSTFALYVGSDQVRKRVVTAVDGLFSANTIVSVDVSESVLTLQAGGRSLTLERGKELPTSFLAPPSRTPTPKR